MNPWWIGFFSRIAACLPVQFCPSCGSPIRLRDELTDPARSLCNACYKEYTQDDIPIIKRKDKHGNHNQS